MGIPFEERQKMPKLLPDVRARNFEEVVSGFTLEQAVQEAKRCLACRTCHRCVREWNCPAILWLEQGPKKSPCIDSVMCMGCGVCIKECPFDRIDAIDLLD
jgi:TPP-dependent indolepyruvate ferredoxin oxidoreductase alpha subunit